MHTGTEQAQNLNSFPVFISQQNKKDTQRRHEMLQGVPAYDTG